MGRVLTNTTSLAYAIESSQGTLPGSPVWKELEPNGLNQYGATITTTPRSPISRSRQRRKGTTTDLDSSVEWEGDLTLEHFLDFAEGFVFARAANPTIIRHLQSGAGFNSLAADDDLAGALLAGYSHSALSAAIPAGTLVLARGFTNDVNNGLFEVDASGTTTATPIVSGAQVDETPTQAANASLDVAGFRFAGDDLSIVVGSGIATITSAADDFTTKGLTPGQVIHVGGVLAANQFGAGASFGFGRIVSIATSTLVLDKVSSTLVTDNGVGDTVDLLYGRFIRNVDTDHADFLERYFQFEAGFPNLGNPGDEYEYAIGNLSNEMAFTIPLTDKATVNFGFVGQDTEVPTSSRKSGASTPVRPVQTSAFNTSSDIARLRIQKVDETGITTCFKSLTLNLRNNVSPEKCLGTLGSSFTNYGNFEVDVEAQLLFSDSRVSAAIRNNETVTMDFIIRNDDGAIAVDIPSLTLGGGDREYPVNESVLINTTGAAFEDAVLGTSIGISIIPILPAA